MKLISFFESSIFHSLIFHSLLIGAFLLLGQPNNRPVYEKFEFEVIEKKAVKIKRMNPKVVINAENSKKNTKRKKAGRKVFGVKRKTLTDETATVVAKIGNTVTKKEDEKILREDESDSLPQPAEEFLITSMPRAIKEIRPEYPQWAKSQKISGRVVFEILIDGLGNVRDVKILQGLHPKLDQLAKDAMFKFKFKPAFIEKKPTAVKIRYAIKFLLES